MIRKTLFYSDHYQVEYISRRLYMKKCTSCGFLINNEIARFCPECGKPVVDFTPEINNAAAENPAPAPVQQPAPAPVQQPAPEASPYSMSSVRNEADFNNNVPAAPVPPMSPTPQNNANYNQAPYNNNQNFAPNSGYAGNPDNGPAPGPVPPQQTYDRRPDVSNMSRSEIVATLDRNIDMTGKVLGSPIFLITVISFLGYLLMQIVNMVYMLVYPYRVVSSVYSDLFNQLGLGSYNVYDYIFRAGGSLYDARPVMLVSSLVVLIPMILSGIGLLIMFCNHKKRPIPRSGYGMAKTNIIFKIVLYSIVLALGVISVIISIAFGGSVLKEFFGSSFSRRFGGSFIVLMLIVLFVGIGIFIAAMFYFAGLLNTLNTVRKACSEGKCPRMRASAFAAVINFILVVLMLISIVMSLDDLGSTSSIITLLSNIFNMLFLLFSGISIFVFRSKITELPGIN